MQKLTTGCTGRISRIAKRVVDIGTASCIVGTTRLPQATLRKKAVGMSELTYTLLRAGSYETRVAVLESDTLDYGGHGCQGHVVIVVWSAENEER
jgi:hypothetical protein